MATTIVMLARAPWAQVQLVCLQCLVQLIFIGMASPFLSTWMNLLELANDFIVLISSYFGFMYSDGLLLIEKLGVYVKDFDLQERIGWF